MKILKNSPELARAVPDLTDVGYLEAMPVPALDLYFNKRIDLPPEHITLLDPPTSSTIRTRASPARTASPPITASRSSTIPGSGASSRIKNKTVLSVLAADATLLLDESDDRWSRRSIIRTLQTLHPLRRDAISRTSTCRPTATSLSSSTPRAPGSTAPKHGSTRRSSSRTAAGRIAPFPRTHANGVQPRPRRRLLPVGSRHRLRRRRDRHRDLRRPSHLSRDAPPDSVAALRADVSEPFDWPGPC